MDQFFKIGKLYQNVTKNEAWPLYQVSEKTVNNIKKLGYLSSGDTFVVVAESYDSNYIHLTILFEDGSVYKIMVLKNTKYIQSWFREIVK